MKLVESATPVRIVIFGIAACTALSCATRPLARDSGASIARMRPDLEYLASDALEGRQAGSAKADEAAAWIAKNFIKLGLAPAGANGDYYQKFNLPNSRRVTAGKTVLANLQAEKSAANQDALASLRKEDFIPTLASSVDHVTGRIVDTGEGSNWDKETWADPKPKIALARLPVAAEGDASNPHGFGSGLRTLAFSAKQHGARGLICIVPSVDRIQAESGDSRDVGMPVVFALERALPGLLKLNGNITIDPCVEHVSRATNNILGMVPGAKPDGEILVIGAHYDHLGWGGSDSLAPGVHDIHHGADDNASGTTLLIELARRFAQKKGTLPRTVVFAAWGAEEMGLLGSDHWVKNATVPMNRVVANINFDMVGRSKDRKLTIMGTGSSPQFDGVIEAENSKLKNPLVISASKTLTTLGGSSDHRSFIVARKPAMFFFTGTHSDYHKPSDTVDKIEFATMADVADLAENVIDRLAREPKTIEWANLPMEPAPAPVQGAEQGLRAWLGTIPDYGADEGGVVLSGTSKGSPAETAGLVAKDIVIKVGEFKIDNINDLTMALGRLKPGQEVDVVYKRGAETKTVKVTIKARR